MIAHAHRRPAPGKYSEVFVDRIIALCAVMLKDAADAGRRSRPVRICSSSAASGSDLFFVPCAPTRWEAVIWRRQLLLDYGPGDGNKRYHFATGAATAIALKSRRFIGGNNGNAAQASRVMRVAVRVDARAYTRVRAVTLLPTYIIQWIEWVIGSKGGSKPVTTATALSGLGGLSSNLNIIVGGYANPARGSAFQGLVARGGWRKVSGSDALAGSIGGATRRDRVAGGNGGFPGFSAYLSGLFGCGHSDAHGQGIGIIGVSASPRQLSQLSGRRLGAIASDTPPGPPSRASTSSSPLAREAIGNLDRHPDLAALRVSEGPQTLRAQMGSGARRPGAGRSGQRNGRQAETRSRGRGHGASVEKRRRVGAELGTLWGGRTHVN